MWLAEKCGDEEAEPRDWAAKAGDGLRARLLADDMTLDEEEEEEEEEWCVGVVGGCGRGDCCRFWEARRVVWWRGDGEGDRLTAPPLAVEFTEGELEGER